MWPGWPERLTMWTPTALASESRFRAGTVWRVVEEQYAVSTRKIVDTRCEQELLEDILEQSKPPVPRGAEKLHYLLQTPFRYGAPYPVGSRFRRTGLSEGVFYASDEIRTALAEFCYYRLRFFQESPDTLLPRQQERLTVFSADYRSGRVVDLTRSPFVREMEIWMHLSDYQATQAFAELARQADVEIIRYRSVRDLEQGINMALLSPTVLSATEPKVMQTWFLYLSAAEANCERVNAGSPDAQWTFPLEQFIH